MPYNSKPGARKYGNNPMKPAAPTAFKMRSGNGPLQFKQMGASPASFGLMDAIGAFGGDKGNKNITAPGSDDKVIKTNEAKTEKVKPQKLDIVNKNPKTGKDEKVGETNTSSRPNGTEAVTKEPKPNETKTEAKPEKKGLWQRYKDHVGSEDYHKTKDSFNELANVVDKSTVRKTDSAKNFKADQKADADAKTKEIATADANKKDAINATQKAEMHKSKLAVNEQNIAASQALEQQRLQGVKVAEDNVSGENELGETEPTATTKGGKNLNTNA